MRCRAGFTLVELAIVISVSSLIVPSVYLLARNLDDQRARGLWHITVAEQVRTVSESLQADRRALAFAGPGPLRLEGKGGCAPIVYEVTPGKALVRRAPERCGGERTLATQVSSAKHLPGGLELTFGFEVRPDQIEPTTVFIPVED